jgi:hypothetical protein
MMRAAHPTPGHPKNRAAAKTPNACATRLPAPAMKTVPAVVIVGWANVILNV